MQIRFRNLTPLAFILLAGCPDNDLAVGAVDAAPSNPANTGGTGGATTGVPVPRPAFELADDGTTFPFGRAA